MHEELKLSQMYWDGMSRFGVDAAVIDPKDGRGHKNAYIRTHRDTQIAAIFAAIDKDSRILDFGCGTGNLTEYLNDLGIQAVGVDIAFDLLALHKGNSALLQYDGNSMPFRNDSFDGATSYVVLNHILSERHLLEALCELRRVLKPGAPYVCIEQTRKLTKITDGGHKKQRCIQDFMSVFSKAGLRAEQVQPIRSGHFPLIYLVRYGFIPQAVFPFLIRVDKWYSSLMSRLPLDYFDTLFVLRKPV